ncbi:MAG TPA: response regulator [Candidatus Methanoperedens sp.]|nr:response regulator [Candidatus Methanoperedens sp.]
MDDDPEMREITSLLLGQRGHHVVSCCNVDETVAAYREHLARGSRFDLVVLDLSIPGQKGGVEGMREILAIDPAAKIVACSGAGLSEAGELGRGFIGFIEKPFTAKDLDALTNLLSESPE